MGGGRLRDGRANRRYHRQSHALRGGDFTASEAVRAASLLHQPRRAGVRAHEPARGGEGRACSLAIRVRQVAPAAVPRRVRRRSRRRRRLTVDATVGLDRAEALYERVFVEYGDDSVAQLGGVHLACEQASNVLTKILEWGRLMAYLEQSTRYIAYDSRLQGRTATTARRSRARRRRAPATSATWTRVRHLRRGAGPDDHCARATRRSPRTATSSTARRSGPRPSTPCGACCRRRRCRTSGSTAPVRHRTAALANALPQLPEASSTPT